MNTSRGRRFVLVCLLVVLTGLGFQPMTPVPVAAVISIQEVPPAPAPIQELQPGTPVERSLTGEEKHSYTLHLKAGQFLELSVIEKRIDLYFRLFAPDGKELVMKDEGVGSGIEKVRMLVDTEGEYALAITAKKSIQPGDYRIELTVRPPTETDRLLLDADSDLAEGQKLFNSRDLATLGPAMAKLEEALKKYTSINEVKKQGNAYTVIGNIWIIAGEVPKGQAAYHEAFKIYSALNDEPNLATVYELLGQAALSNNEDQKGLDYYLQSLRLHEKLGNQGRAAVTYMALGIAYNRFGEKQKALDGYQKAIPILRIIDHKAALAATLNNTGRVYDDLGEKQKALEHYFEAMAIEKVQQNPRAIGILHNNIAKIYTDLGDTQKAIEHFKLAVDILTVEKDRIFLTQSLINLGRMYLKLNQMVKATENYEQALILAKEIKNKVQEGRILLDLGKIQLQTGNQDKAMELFEQAQAIAIQVGDQVTQANYYFQKGMAAEKLDDKFALFQKNLDIRQVLNNQIELADALGYMAMVERDRGNLASAVQYAERALQLAEKVRSNVTSDQFRTSYFSVVRRYYDIYVDLLIRLHGKQPSGNFLAIAFEASERAHARGLLDLMNESRIDIREGVDPKLLEQERNLKQLLQDKSNRLVSLKTRKTSAEVLQAAEKEIAQYSEEYQRVQNQIRQSSPRYSALTQPQPLSLQQIQAQVLTPDTILLEYYLGEKVSYLWVVSHAGIEVYELPKQEVINDLARKAYESVSVRESSLRDTSAKTIQTGDLALSQKSDPIANPMLALSQMILGPVRNQLGTKRVVIVPDGALHLIPFAALPVPQAIESPSPKPKWSYLIEHNEIVMLPSASTLAVLRQETSTRQPAPKKLAILADPVFSKEDVRVASTVNPSPAPGQPESTQVATRNLTVLNSLEKTKDAPSPEGMSLTRLPGTRKEAKTLYSLIAPTQGKLAMDFEANREFAASQELNQYQMIHFATHGFVNLQNPEFSGLALSLVNKKGEEQDGFLLLSDVYNMNLNAELVVLSACETGLGKQFQGEGLVGLTRGFMYAGSPRIIVSLWSVSDQATAELMERLYEGLLKQGKTPAAALRQAQLAIMKEKRWRSPFYWAAFQLQGEYR